MRWMAPAPPASNVPQCSCHQLLGKEPPNVSKNSRPRFGKDVFQVHGISENGRVIFNKAIKRSQDPRGQARPSGTAVVQ
jgi:hypothetical protein